MRLTSKLSPSSPTAAARSLDILPSGHTSSFRILPDTLEPKLPLFIHLTRMFRRRGTIPVIQHLPGQDSIEHKARHESVQDEFVIHLLKRREDAGQTA